MLKELKKNCYKGTRILVGNEKREYIEHASTTLREEGFTEISIPVIQFSSLFSHKVGKENNNLMFNFKDRKERDLCLAPEYTAIIQNLALDTFKYEKDLKLFYIQECFRGEKPQEGRYRQFTQIGVEIINPVSNNTSMEELIFIAENLVGYYTIEYNLTTDIKRGLDYYKEGKGFEINCNKLGAQKQVCGGGEYEGGIGFAIGVDRILLLNTE